MINCNQCGREVTSDPCACGTAAPVEFVLGLKHREGLVTSLDVVLGPRPRVRDSVHPPSAAWLAAHFRFLDDRLLQELDMNGTRAVAEACARARRELEFGRPMHLPSARRLYDNLLLDPGPSVLAAMYRLGDAEAVRAFAAHRAETLHLLGCRLCPDDDVDEARLRSLGRSGRCQNPLPCPHHPKWKPPPELPV